VRSITARELPERSSRKDFASESGAADLNIEIHINTEIVDINLRQLERVRALAGNFYKE